MFKKAFWVPYEDSANYPTLAKTMEAISKYCEENGESYTFINDDEVEINGKRYEIKVVYLQFKLYYIYINNKKKNRTEAPSMATEDKKSDIISSPPFPF